MVITLAHSSEQRTFAQRLVVYRSGSRRKAHSRRWQFPFRVRPTPPVLIKNQQRIAGGHHTSRAQTRCWLGTTTALDATAQVEVVNRALAEPISPERGMKTSGGSGAKSCVNRGGCPPRTDKIACDHEKYLNATMSFSGCCMQTWNLRVSFAARGFSHRSQQKKTTWQTAGKII